MNRCLVLAKKGRAKAAPNPMVGCVIVHEGEIIGEGYHEQYGGPHAEVNAVASVKDPSLLKASTLYVNLEPCAHFGKTPPCADLIIEKEIPKVVIGCVDSFSKVCGAGIARMKSQGTEVITGVLEKESRQLNKRFFTFHEKKRPYIILKWAESSDGFIAPAQQQQAFWMTGKEAKKTVHQWRAEEMAILIGKNTALADNPSLTVREVEGKNPIRLLIDKKASLTKELALFQGEGDAYALTEKAKENHQLAVDFQNFLPSLMQVLHSKGIQSLIVEGGAITLQQFIDADLWDEARVFTAPIELKDGVNSPVFEQEAKESLMMGKDQLRLYFS
jgi:diaminohydroxyphosphoribosylaminopyrimidine deaminase/5-amino-6-(5-phosphoribosylamino)uracil reductase